MPRPRPPYLHIEHTRNGAIVWYVRRGKGKRVRIRGAYGSDKFQEAYLAAVVATVPQRATRATSGSLAWLIDLYRDSGAWAILSAASRRQRDNIFRNVVKVESDYPFAKITKTAIIAGIDRRRATPFMAKAFLKAMRGLFHWVHQWLKNHMEPQRGSAQLT